MKCWHCQADYEIPDRKLKFRAQCDTCHSWLHCCRGCRHHKPGLPNQCEIPDTEYISDREAANFCESFEPVIDIPPTNTDLKSAAEKLFGTPTDEETQNKKSFDDLF